MHDTTRRRLNDAIENANSIVFKNRFTKLIENLEDNPFQVEMEMLMVKFDERASIGLIGVRSILDLLLAEITRERDQMCPVLYAQMRTAIEFSTEPFNEDFRPLRGDVYAQTFLNMGRKIKNGEE